jgi:hypothetical protein
MGISRSAEVKIYERGRERAITLDQGIGSSIQDYENCILD